MKNIILSVSVFCLIVVAATTGCQQRSYNDLAATSSAFPFSGLRSTPQTLSVPAGTETIVYGASGTMLHFYSNSFKDANGNIITSGTVNIQLVEMYKPGDMIKNSSSTIANGQILQSGGQINITASVNGQQVFANAYGLGFKHSATSSQPMALFYGSTSNADSVTTWTQSDTTQNGTTASGTTQYANNTFYYFDTCKNFSWANCDWFFSNDSPKTTVSVILPDTSFNATTTQLYLVLPNINSYVGDSVTAVLSNAETPRGSSSYTAATNTMVLVSEMQTSIVPSGLNYELVVIANKKGTYYYYEQSGIVPHNGIKVTATMTPQTQAGIIALLDQL